MGWWFLIGIVWGVLFWVRRRHFKEDRRNAATSGEMRDMGGRGGF